MEYSVYKGDDLVCIGTAQECAKAIGVKVSSIQWYATPSGKRHVEKCKRPEKCIVVERLD